MFGWLRSLFTDARGPFVFARYTDRARKALDLASAEAKRFNHEYVGTEHLLLGLLRERDGVGANVLKSSGVELDRVRAEVEKRVPRGNGGASRGRLPMTPRAKHALDYALEEARALNHNYVGTEHLLLGLLREHDGVAAMVLRDLGLDLEGVRRKVLDMLGAAPADPA